MPKKIFRKRGRIAILFFCSILCIYGLVLISNTLVVNAAQNKCFAQIDKIPPTNVALVLGANKKSRSGHTNLYFKYRMEAAAQLYKAGKVKHLLVSGDNHISTYDEATDMKDYLVSLGVPENNITLDYAGFRTLDSVVRAKEIFSQNELIIVSQHFHNERALFLCESFGIKATAYDAEDVPKAYSYRTALREKLARVKAFLDVYILHTSPKFLGKKEPIIISEML